MSGNKKEYRLLRKLTSTTRSTIYTGGVHMPLRKLQWMFIAVLGFIIGNSSLASAQLIFYSSPPPDPGDAVTDAWSTVTWECEFITGGAADCTTDDDDGDGVPDEDDDVVILSDDEIELDVTGTVRNLIVNGTLTRSGSSKTVGIYGTEVKVDGTVSGNVQFYLYGSNITVYSPSGTGTINIGGRLANRSGTTTLTVNMDMTVNHIYNLGSGGSEFLLTVSAGRTLHATGNVSMDGTNGLSSRERAGTITVNGTLIVDGTLYLTTDNTAPTPNSGLTINTGGLVQSAGAFTGSGGTGVFELFVDNGGTLEFTSGNFGDLAAPGFDPNFDTGATVIFSSSTDQTVNHPQAGTGITHTLRIEGGGTKTLASDFTIGDGLGTGKLVRAGTAALSNGGFTLAYNQGTLEYAGSAAQQVGDEWPAASGPTNVIVNNPNGVSFVAGTGNRSVAGTLTFTSGVLDVATAAATIDLGTTGTFSGEAAGSYLLGTVTATRNVSGTETFGNIGFELSGGTTDPNAAVTVTRVNGTQGIVSVGGNESIARRFSVSYSGSAFNKNLTIKWLPPEDNGKTLNIMELWGFNGTKWYPISDSPQDASATRSLTESITSFDQIYTATDALNPLPIELTDIVAQVQNGEVVLRWQTATEVNNSGFEIEHSIDNVNFEKVGFVPGAGNTTEAQEYSFNVGKLPAGKHYFRLKAIDFDGVVSYSPVVEAEVPLTEAFSLSPVYPNPFQSVARFTLTVAEPQQVRVEVFDMLGRRVEVLHDGQVEGGRVYTFTLDGTELPAGMYFYRVTGEHFTASKNVTLLK